MPGVMRQAREEANKSAEDNPSGTTAMAIFPYADRRQAQSFTEPLKMENEMPIHDKRASNLWQLYALGVFFALRWAWVGWKKRKNAGEPGED